MGTYIITTGNSDWWDINSPRDAGRLSLRVWTPRVDKRRSSDTTCGYHDASPKTLTMMHRWIEELPETPHFLRYDWQHAGSVRGDWMTFHIISHRKTRQPKAKSRLAVGTLSIPTCFPRGNSSMDKQTANRPHETHAATTRLQCVWLDSLSYLFREHWRSMY